MAAYLPHKKGFPAYTSRYVSEDLGFALSVNYLFKYLIVTPNNLTACSVVISYWHNHVPTAVWIVLFIIFIGAVNLLGVKSVWLAHPSKLRSHPPRVFGELEFWFSSIKVITLIGLILMGIVM
jgi:amino acid transporter